MYSSLLTRCRPVLASCLILLSGCSELDSISASLDSSTEPTFQFWASLQGIHYREFPEVEQKLAAVKAAGANYDVDQMAALFEEVSRKYQHISDQFNNLDATDVDPDAVTFRKQLADIHRSLADAYQRFSVATKERDFEAVQKGRTELPQLTQQFVNIWNGRNALMDSLGKKYSKDFNVQQ